MIVVADRVKETTTTTGTGTLNLAGAETGFITFVAGVATTSELDYCIVGQAGGGAAGEWEVGTGVVTDASPDTLTRVTIHASSNAGAAVNFSAGTKDVFLTVPAVRSVVNLETFDPSAAGSVDIDIAGYEAVRLFGWLEPATDGATFGVRLSTDGGSTFKSGATDYRFGRKFITVASSGDVSDEAHTDLTLIGATGNDTSEQTTFDISIIGPAEANSKTSVTCIGTTINDNGLIGTHWGSGYYDTAGVTDAVQLLYSAGNIDRGHVAAYGYRAP